MISVFKNLRCKIRASSIYRDQQGLTLIEALIAITLLAIITTLLAPSMSNYFDQANIKGAAEAFYNDINLARTTATKSTDTASITATTGGSWCYGLSTGAISCACSSAPSASNCNLGITTATNFKNTSLAMSPATITFSTARGATTSSTATFSGSGRSITITINSMGIPSICSPSGTVGGYPTC